jgi:hypothetical protein
VNRGILTEIPDSLQLARERSIPEYLSHAKWALSALALVSCWSLMRQGHFAALAFLFAMIAVDDAFLIHESYGGVVAEKLGIPFVFAMDPKEIGEAIIFGLMGGLAILVLGLSYLRADRTGKALVLAILLTILALGITGVLFDAFQHMSTEVGTPRFRCLLVLFFTIVADGGKTILGSAILGLSVLSLQEARAERTAPRGSRIKPRRRARSACSGQSAPLRPWTRAACAACARPRGFRRRRLSSRSGRSA